MGGKKTETSSGTSRRRFLTLAGVGTVAGGAALAVGAEPAKAEESAPADGSRSYRESEHVKTYYRLARF